MPKWGELKHEFSKKGCRFISEGTNHEWWYSPITGENFQMGRHNSQEVRKETEMTIRKKAGIPKKR